MSSKAKPLSRTELQAVVSHLKKWTAQLDRALSRGTNGATELQARDVKSGQFRLPGTFDATAARKAAATAGGSRGLVRAALVDAIRAARRPSK